MYDQFKKILDIGLIGLSTLLLFLLACGIWIGYEIKVMCHESKQKYGGDCVEALVIMVDDENQAYRMRNRAIWTLGQLGDGRGLPILEKYYTGKIPNREPLDDMISQYELKKAIKLANGGTNLSFIWRAFLIGI